MGRWNGADILQEGARADGTRTRWTFTEIMSDSFHWRGEALYPDKQTWALEGEFLAKREDIMSPATSDTIGGPLDLRV
ncbi:MAG TPA: hypothetical protein VKE51_17540 [Vicinamibacterales bacterium]|nr:hypothetical protein [Vicinamibacterales bacterium]